jgi:hypothetical protein
MRPLTMPRQAESISQLSSVCDSNLLSGKHDGEHPRPPGVVFDRCDILLRMRRTSLYTHIALLQDFDLSPNQAPTQPRHR